MPLTSAESLVAIDGCKGLEAPETELCLAGVAARLNRLAVLRAAFRGVAVLLFAASALGACAAWLSPGQFRTALAALFAVAAALLALALRSLRRDWAGSLEAARWVEHKIPLEQRLLTLVSARGEAATARLWPELVADNQAQLPRWRESRLGIPALPADVLLLLAALLAAWLFLVPWYAAVDAPREVPGVTVASPHGEDGTPGAGEGGGAAGPGAQAQLAAGAPGAAGGGAKSGVAGAAASGAIAQLQAELKQDFARSVGGKAMLRGGKGKPGDGDQPGGERDDVAESGLGKSNAEAGGRVPDATMARREQDDGTGQAVRRAQGAESGAAAKAEPGPGGGGRPGKPRAQAQIQGVMQAGGRPSHGGHAPADGPLALGDEGGTKSHSGGAGAGSGKATAPLLAKAPLTLDGGRSTAHFALTLGGATGDGDADGPKAIVTQPRSRIAEAERGPQEADHAVRHEEIPAEYEAVVKRIFKREP